MGFKSVFRSLVEVFPQVDVRILKAVAIEHSKDSDAAAEVVLFEVLPCLSNCSVGVLTSGTDQDVKHPSIGVELEDHSFPPKNQKVVGEVDAGSSFICEDANQMADTIHVNSESTDDLLADFLIENLHGEKNFEQSCINTGSGELIGLEKDQEMDELDQVSHVASISSMVDDMLVNVSHLENLEHFCLSTGSDELMIPLEKLQDEVGLDQVFSNVASSSLMFDDTLATISHCDHSCSGTNLSSEDHNLEFASSLLCEEKPDSSESGVLPGLSCGATVGECEKPTSGASTKKSAEFEILDTAMVDVEGEVSSTIVVTQSGHICRTDLLEDTITDAKNNKKILFSAMESVINMMKQVEFQEKAAEQAKEEAAKGGLLILTEVENLKKMLQHAKEANDMHAGEVYGEKAILATEMQELQCRLLHLSDERDKSLAILEVMRQNLEARLTTTEEEQKAAEKLKVEKEECAMVALAEQKLIMEMVVQESKRLQQEAEENSKLREFLIERGRIVDALQGEISVICQDVKFLKEKSDEGVPISKALSSSHLSCILPSSISSSKSTISDRVSEHAESFESIKKTSSNSTSSNSSFMSMASDRTLEQSDSLETPKKTSPESSVSVKSQENSPKGKIIRNNGKVVSDEEWDLFKDESELYG